MRTLALAIVATLAAACGDFPEKTDTLAPMTPQGLVIEVDADLETSLPEPKPKVDAEICKKLVDEKNEEILATIRVANEHSLSLRDFIDLLSEHTDMVPPTPVRAHGVKLETGHIIDEYLAETDDCYVARNGGTYLGAGQRVLDNMTRMAMRYDGSLAMIAAHVLLSGDSKDLRRVKDQEVRDLTRRHFLDYAADPNNFATLITQAHSAIVSLKRSQFDWADDVLTRALDLSYIFLIYDTQYNRGEFSELYTLEEIRRHVQWHRDSVAYKRGLAEHRLCLGSQMGDESCVEPSKAVPPTDDFWGNYDGYRGPAFWVRRYLDAERLGFDPDYAVWAQRVSLVMLASDLGSHTSGRHSTQLLAEADTVSNGPGKAAYVAFLRELDRSFKQIASTRPHDRLATALSR